MGRREVGRSRGGGRWPWGGVRRRGVGGREVVRGRGGGKWGEGGWGREGEG